MFFVRVFSFGSIGRYGCLGILFLFVWYFFLDMFSICNLVFWFFMGGVVLILLGCVRNSYRHSIHV